ncbi:FtsI Cell division protein FtsI/penicillin-binding protein 2 [Burkholderiaceae bacterium]|jgi:cell division protein FtsI (penicillin-binding protein 3)
MSSRSVQYASNPLLASKTPIWRSQLIVACIALGFIGLVFRAAYVQVVGNAFFRKQGTVRFERQLEIPANRGRILDRHGLILASSVPMPSIWASPEELEDDPVKLKALAQLLNMPLGELQNKVKNKKKSFVWLRRQLDMATGKKVTDLKFAGVYTRMEYKRMYPQGEAAAHVVGFTNIENTGQEGVELAFNTHLGGKSGSRRVIKDGQGQVIEGIGDMIPPEEGRDLQLSIDSKVQYFAYQRLREAVLDNKAAAGSVVVLDAQTGDVLALANYPSYSPDKRSNLSGAQLRNRALTDTFEPGSTMKPFVVGLAMEKGLIKPETMIDTAPGKLNMYGMTVTDAHPHGMLSVNEVIQKSSNVGTVKIAMRMPPKDMWEMYTQVGFGQKPQVPFPGAVAGRLRAYKTWRPMEQATMSYGYGLSTSLFQLAQAYTVFARDGEVAPVSLLKRQDKVAGVRVMNAQNAASVRHMLHMVTGPGGTAPKAQTMGYSVGGKTGTAHKLDGKTYAAKKYRGFFVGLAPIDNPRIVVAVMIDEPTAGRYYGGDVAAPVFSQTVQQTLRMLEVQPDMAVKPQVVAKAEAESF